MKKGMAANEQDWPGAFVLVAFIGWFLRMSFAFNRAPAEEALGPPHQNPFPAFCAPKQAHVEKTWPRPCKPPDRPMFTRRAVNAGQFYNPLRDSWLAGQGAELEKISGGITR
jgi:hypothetical protein